MSNWIDHRAIVEAGVELGDFIKVWAFAHIMPFAKIGDYCSIGATTEIGRATIVGAHSRIGYGVFIPNGAVIGSYVFIGPRVVMTDDKYPFVENDNYTAEPPTIEDHACIGAGAVILPGIRIGHGAMIGAGAVVTHNVEAESVVIGNPAKHLKVKEEIFDGEREDP